MVSDRLVVSLTLRIAETVLTFPAGSIKSFELHVTRIGFSAQLSLVVSSEQEPDPLFSSFIAPDLMSARLSVEPVEATPDGSEREPLVLDGIVLEKTLEETASESLAGGPVIIRRYGIKFADPGQALWKQHFPTELYANATLKTVLDAHRPGGISFAYDWPLLLEERSVIALGLGNPENRASFYDWLLWVVDRQGGVLEYDSTQKTYRLGARKSSDSSATTLLKADIARYEVVIPPLPRAELHVLNGFAPSPQNKLVTVPDVVQGVRDDRLVYTPIQSRFDRDVELATNARRAPDHRVRVSFAQYPRTTFRPNKGLKFEDELSPNLFVAQKPYRIIELSVRAREPEDPALASELDEESALYVFDAVSVLEPRADRELDLPAYQRPAYPFYVEGKVVSDGGQQTERTWAVIEDQKNSLLYHRVDVPLFNKKVVVRYEPSYFPGLFFFPAYKNQRVLLALHFDEAHIDRFVDWADNARQPQDTQGQAIAFGKKGADGTTLTHVYKEGKPVLTIERKQDSDQQTLSISDGTMMLSVGQTSLAPALEKVYDLTANVSAAKGKLETAVKGGVSEVTGTFSNASAKVQEKLSSTSEEVEAKLLVTEAELSTRSAMVRAEAEGLISGLSQSIAEVAAAVAEAKAAIERLVRS